jgi:hypothetical protein
MKIYLDYLPSEHLLLIYRLHHEMNFIDVKNELKTQIMYVRTTLKWLKICSTYHHPMLYHFKTILMYYLQDTPMNFFYKKQFYRYLHSYYMKSIQLELFFYYIKS